MLFLLAIGVWFTLDIRFFLRTLAYDDLSYWSRELELTMVLLDDSNDTLLSVYVYVINAEN